MEALAEYAKIVQNNNMVPIVEPEVLMDGSHSIEDCYSATSRALETLFNSLTDHQVNIKGTILKPNMVTSGSTASEQANISLVAEKTVECLQNSLPDPYLVTNESLGSELLSTCSFLQLVYAPTSCQLGFCYC